MAHMALTSRKEEVPSSRTIIDMEGLRVALEYGQKCRKVSRNR